MLFKLVIAASKIWRKPKGNNPLPKPIQGVKFSDGSQVGSEITTQPPDQSITQNRLSLSMMQSQD